ncbi:hypothetical protein AB0B28_13965, partial [Glycomyces sp. NPDC046736]|uniref:hypothetical protein n=1 Tax=Glycomyces sp. NPDC046736 TaxID=3155615 RepID=UPI0033F975B6
ARRPPPAARRPPPAARRPPPAARRPPPAARRPLFVSDAARMSDSIASRGHRRLVGGVGMR